VLRLAPPAAPWGQQLPRPASLTSQPDPDSLPPPPLPAQCLVPGWSIGANPPAATAAPPPRAPPPVRSPPPIRSPPPTRRPPPQANNNNPTNNAPLCNGAICDYQQCAAVLPCTLDLETL
jgi:hypothetical protein